MSETKFYRLRVNYTQHGKFDRRVEECHGDIYEFHDFEPTELEFHDVTIITEEGAEIDITDSLSEEVKQMLLPKQ